MAALQYTEQLYGTVFGPYGPFHLRENGEAAAATANESAASLIGAAKKTV